MDSTNNINRFLYDLFPDAMDFDGEFSALKQLKVERMSVFIKANRLEIHTISSDIVSIALIMKAEECLKQKLGAPNLTLKVKCSRSYSVEEYLSIMWSELMQMLTSKVALCRGILHGSKYEISGNKIIINLLTSGADILKAQNCHTMLEQHIKGTICQSVKVEFCDMHVDHVIIEEYVAEKVKNEAKVVSSAITALPENQKQKKYEFKSYGSGDMPSKAVITGKPFTDSIMKISEVTPDSGKVAVAGEVFRTEYREIRGGKYIYIFDVTDFTSSVTVKMFLEKKDFGNISERITEGVCLRIRGEAQYDKFSKELAIMAFDIVETEREIRHDDAEEKRVELHLHTQMSSMDGVTAVKDLVKRAAQWGHKAIAVTDHGIVQAYPDAYAASKKNNIKVIYGLECYLLDDSVPIVYGIKEHSLDDDFVVFDIETTGLNPQQDRITEIGAVKVRNGQIVDRFSAFVNPGVSIPSFIVKLTGITNDMVKDAPPIEQVLNEFMEFIQGSVLVAHNANFDVGFIKHNAKIIGEKVKNPYLDTLELCRKMFPELGRYKLNIVAKHLKIELENHHRAVDDSMATAKIFIHCLNELKEKGCKNIKDIQNAFDGEVNLKASSYHAIILVKNKVGLKNLYKIVSQSHLKYLYKKPRVPKKLLMEYREGLILGSACEAGELYRAILNNKSEDEISKIVRFYDYLEIQPLGNNQFLINNGKVSSQEELKKINKKIIRLGERHRKPVVATCDVHFMDPRDEVFRRILMSGRGFTDADNQAPLYFRTTEEMLEEFSYLGEEKAREVVIENTNLIADMIESIAPVLEGTFPPKIEGAEQDIENMAMNRAKEIYGEELPEVVAKRLEKELNSIIKNGFAVMYLIAQKLVSKSLNDGYLVGSRGSVGSSFVANMSGITEVNSLQPHYVCEKCKYSEFILDGSYDCGFDLPEKDCPNCGNKLKKDGYDIPFETFLGFDGDKEPDIDLNFSGDYQPVAHKYTEELFGEGYVFRAGTIASVAEKTAYGYVKNYLDERSIVVTNAEINRLVKGCTGIKRTTGQHPGGIMIVPKDKEIFDFSPIQRPADDIKSEIITTHFDYHFLHGSILKLDILGHDDPTVIRMLEDLTGVDARTIPIGEKKTMSLFSSTEALGVKPEDIGSETGTFAVPEFGTKFVRQMLLDTKPQSFSELIRISGLSHGTDVWLNNAQELIRDGITTLSQSICCRDDIMIYLMHAGLPPKTAFKIMEDVRKGKGVKEEYEAIMKENNVPDWYIQSCKKIKYMFPKAHAAAYVMMAFRIAWFKVYYPEAFYATYFTVRADDFDAEMMTYGQDKVRNKIKEFEMKGNNITTKEKNVLTILEVVNEMYARGINFLPINLYLSEATKFRIEDKSIRPPMNALQGLGGAAAQNIIEARKNGEFLSIDELRTRAKISKSVIEILERNNVLEGMPESNQLCLF
ncbi:PolC-type DNA polymerase III [Ruminiclostridium cellulolyticum]|uniref:DNA polymerase III PolC-type n=1 Tax=Ruminiclostridium cellulolyticum (strain ATCC 35319 / DSM 5812 / JCM 6584 / H10) TaxID=394503 RepID=B8I6E2_RUMCH|nr:PolC-type DNA polymerase III [Ruminiclostridium cellulolyticum]ACL74834.1 DNA polymerase III, alpha subunit [Ruminiclostridium cellulolyticum H10]